MTVTLPKFATVRKAAAAAVGLASELVALGFLHGTALTWTQLVIGVATAVGVYAVPNTKNPGPSPAHPAAKAIQQP